MWTFNPTHPPFKMENFILKPFFTNQGMIVTLLWLWLQGKMQSENLLRTECSGYDSDEGRGSQHHQGYYTAAPHHYNVIIC